MLLEGREEMVYVLGRSGVRSQPCGITRSTIALGD